MTLKSSLCKVRKTSKHHLSIFVMIFQHIHDLNKQVVADFNFIRETLNSRSKLIYFNRNHALLLCFISIETLKYS